MSALPRWSQPKRLTPFHVSRESRQLFAWAFLFFLESISQIRENEQKLGRMLFSRVTFCCGMTPRAREFFLNFLSAGAMLLDRIGPPGRCSGCWRRPRRSQLRGELRHDPIAPAG